MDSIYQFKQLNKYFIDDLSLEILTYLYGSREYQKYQKIIDSFNTVEEARADAEYELARKYTKRKDDSNLAGMYRANILPGIENIIAELWESEQTLADFPLLVNEFLQHLNRLTLTDADFIKLTREIFRERRRISIERAMEIWKANLSPEAFEKLVEIRKNSV